MNRLSTFTALGPAVAIALILPALGGCRKTAEGATNVVVIGAAQPALGDPLGVPANEGESVLRAATAQGLVRFDATGQIEPGLAERWNVSNDGLSYIFRLGNGAWPDGRKIMARDIARLIERQRKAVPDNPTRDALGAVDEAVAMTDRVIELRLRVPRANLLTLLAQPEFALIREGLGTGPFKVREPKVKPPRGEAHPIELRQQLPGLDGEEGAREDVTIEAMPAAQAIAAFRDERAALVLGGTVGDLPLVTGAKLPRESLRFDPVAGLFGLVPARGDGPAADPAIRRLLSEALDRPALIASLGVPGLDPRATLLQDGLAGIGTLPQPAWLGQPMAARRAALVAEARRLLPQPKATGATGATAAEPRHLLVSLPAGPGGDIILMRLNADWGALGFEVERAAPGARADFAWIDAVAPSDSPAWFLRQFRCVVKPVCNAPADALLQQARDAAIAAQRNALLGEAARLMDADQLFIAVAAPVRWSLASRAVPGFVENRYARHALGGLKARAGAGGMQ
ncbi:MAG: ABC transporter substrate-binding protein [Sphingomicrobium sp.]